jgi:hypothetical protein
MLAPVASLVRAALPKKVDVAAEEPGLTLFQPAAPVAAKDEVLLASRFNTKLLVTMAASAGSGVRKVRPDESSDISAISEVPLRLSCFTLLYALDHI